MFIDKQSGEYFEAFSFSIVHIPFFICHCRKVAIPAMTNEKWNMNNGK